MDTAGIGRIFIVAAAAATLAGCFGGGTREQAETVTTVRQTVVTAPADLQLLCASEAASQYGAEADQVLPVASRQTEEGVYDVDLTIAGAPATCTVDDDANVRTITLGEA
jgi:ABC-type uncharacterized transport system auxiliary subunit